MADSILEYMFLKARRWATERDNMSNFAQAVFNDNASLSNRNWQLCAAAALAAAPFEPEGGDRAMLIEANMLYPFADIRRIQVVPTHFRGSVP